MFYPVFPADSVIFNLHLGIINSPCTTLTFHHSTHLRINKCTINMSNNLKHLRSNNYHFFLILNTIIRSKEGFKSEKTLR
jgi:hypothetical protein